MTNYIPFSIAVPEAKAQEAKKWIWAYLAGGRPAGAEDFCWRIL